MYATYLTSDLLQEPESKSFAKSPRDLKSHEKPANMKKVRTPESFATPKPSSTKKRLETAESVSPKQSTTNKRATSEILATAKPCKSRQPRKIYCRESSDENVVSGRDLEWKPMDSSDEEPHESLSVSNLSVSSSGSSKSEQDVRAQYVKSLQSFRTYNPSSTE